MNTPHRRWFQFGLRGLFWLTLAIAVATKAGVTRYQNEEIRDKISHREQLFTFFIGLSR